MILTYLAVLLTGYSLFGALLIGIGHLGPDQHGPLGRAMGWVLLLALAGLQLYHFVFLQHDPAIIDGPLYLALLFLVAPAFYLFSTPLLRPQADFRPLHWAHGLPVLIAPLLPASMAKPLAFALGAGYLLWLARQIFALREQRAGYRRELALLGLVFGIALLVTLLALGWPGISDRTFIALYACAIGCALLLVQLVLQLSPRLSAEVTELAREAYAKTTLGQVDVAAKLARLKQLMSEDRLYEDPDLDLKSLAAKLDLSGHQLSELVNSRLGMGVSRYIRDRRIAAAKGLLIAKPSQPVLTIGLEAGFNSQSSFYSAFREAVGMTPGRYRHIYKATD